MKVLLPYIFLCFLISLSTLLIGVKLGKNAVDTNLRNELQMARRNFQATQEKPLLNLNLDNETDIVSTFSACFTEVTHSKNATFEADSTYSARLVNSQKSEIFLRLNCKNND